jgi:hypothetical protein
MTPQQAVDTVKPAERFRSIQFRNFKAFRAFELGLSNFNVLVGPNNAGKSTILGTFRILSEGLRRARARRPERVPAPAGTSFGHKLSLAEIPIATENVFHNYDDSEPAIVDFTISNGSQLRLFFPERGACYLLPISTGTTIYTTDAFKREFDVSVAFVPILGPVEHDEPLYQL